MKWIVVLVTLFCLYQGRRPPAKSIVTGCPRGWNKFRYTDRCFYISTKFYTYANGKKFCEAARSELAPPYTCDEQVELNALLVDYRRYCGRSQNCEEFWIGIHNLSGSQWKTARGLEFDKNHPCQNWGTHFPRGDGRCVLMSYGNHWKRGEWKNENCSRKLKYVCIRCPNNFQYFPEINECLYFNPKPVTWQFARLSCPKVILGAQLLTIKSPLKQKVIARYLGSIVGARIASECKGLKDTGLGLLIWTAGQTKDPNQCRTPYVWKPLGNGWPTDMPFTYSNWFPGTPNCFARGENCVAIATASNLTFRWDDIHCKGKFCSVCEL